MRGPYFRDHQIAAPLKPVEAEDPGHTIAHIRDHLIAAPLKLPLPVSSSLPSGPFPRSSDRGQALAMKTD
jgi:hypothetical protein